MAAQRSLPSPANRYQVEHTERLRRTFHALTGRDLIDPTLAPEAAAEALFHAQFVVLSHDAAPDPILTYGNRKALELFELTWEELIQMPSRLTAEAPDRAGGRGCWRKLRPRALSPTMRVCASRVPAGSSGSSGRRCGT